MKTSFKRFMSLVLVVLTLVACCAPAITAASETCDHRYDPSSTPILEQAATCQELGWRLFTCLDCGQAFIPDEEWTAVDPSKHVLVEKTDADCANPGYKWQECTVCGWNKDGSEEKEAVAAIGNHTYVYPAGFDCAVGAQNVPCSVCGKKFNLPAKVACSACPAGTYCEHAHYGATTFDPGKHGYENAELLTKCDACGKSETVIHNFVTEVTKVPTCGKGEMTFACECGVSYKIAINATLSGADATKANHDAAGYKTWADQDSTCDADGWKNRVSCDTCGYDNKNDVGVKVNKKNHTITTTGDAWKMIDSEVDTCTTSAWELWKCSLCNKEEIRNESELIQHMEKVELTDWVVAPDATHKNTAQAYVTCANCDMRELMELPFSEYKMNGREYVKVNGRYQFVEEVYNNFVNETFYLTYYHGYHLALRQQTNPAEMDGGVVRNNIKDATCTLYGQYAEVCRDCGWEGKTAEIAPAGHKFTIDKPAQAATCMTPGYDKHKECSVCGAKDDAYKTTNATGHKYGTRTASTYLAPVCGTAGWELCTNPVCTYIPEGSTTPVATPDKKVPIAALKHDYTKVVEVEANCREVADYIFKCQRDCCKTVNHNDVRDGKTYASSSEYNYEGVYAGLGNAVDPDNHKSTTWTTVTPATCLSEGFQTGTCGACGKADLTRTLPQEKHVHITTLPADHKLGAIAGLVINSKDITKENYPDAVKIEGNKVIFDLEDLYAIYGVVQVNYPATCGPNGTDAKSAYICEKRVNNEEKHHWEEIVDPTKKPEHIYQKVSDYVGPTCTEGGNYELWQCIICGIADNENVTKDGNPRNGEAIPSFHSNIMGMAGAYNEKTGMRYDPHFTYNAKVEAKCDATHNCVPGCEAYFICNKEDANGEGGCGAIFAFSNKLNKYIEVPSLSDLALTFEYNVVEEGNYAIHCPRKNCTICNNGAAICSGNGLEGRTVCKNCKKVVNAGTTLENKNGASLALDNESARGGKGHLGYQKLDAIDSTCYSKGKNAGWKCTDPACSLGGKTVGYKDKDLIPHTQTQVTITITGVAANDAYAQKEDACTGYQYTYTVCTMCKAASEMITLPEGFTYETINNAANTITWVADSVAHENADGNKLYVGWKCNDEAVKALGTDYTDDDLVCAVCKKGEGLKGDANPFKVSHTEDATTNFTQAPTCLINGYTTTVCAECGVKYVIDIILASDAYHDWDVQDVPANEFVGSHQIKTCKICKEVEVTTPANDQLTGFKVKLEVVGDVFVKSGTLQVKVVLVNLLDKDLPIQGVELAFPASENLIYRDVEFTPVEGFDKTLAKVEANANGGTAKFVMNTYSDKNGNKNEMTIPAKAEVAIATLTFVVSDKDRTTVDLTCADDIIIGGTATTATVLREVQAGGKELNYGVSVADCETPIVKDVTLLGDANKDGTVNVTDSQMLADLLVALDENFEGEYNKALDVDKDGKITLKDLAILQRYMTERYTAKEFYNFGLLDGEKWA